MTKSPSTDKTGTKGSPHHLDLIPEKYIQKFYDRCEPQPNGCIYMKGNLQNSGYLNWWYRQTDTDQIRYILAHRFSALISGKFPEAEVNRLCVLHNCDAGYAKGDVTYRKCVNPDHLWLGTQKQNIRDCMAKGRYSPPPVLRGEDNFNSTITTAQAEWIIANHHVITQKEMAEQLGIAKSTVECIHANKTWRHLPR